MICLVSKSKFGKRALMPKFDLKAYRACTPVSSLFAGDETAFRWPSISSVYLRLPIWWNTSCWLHTRYQIYPLLGWFHHHWPSRVRWPSVYIIWVLPWKFVNIRSTSAPRQVRGTLNNASCLLCWTRFSQPSGAFPPCEVVILPALETKVASSTVHIGVG